MIRPTGWLPLILALCAAADSSAQDTVLWSSTPDVPNVTSSGSAMDGTFRFEIGVFTGSFVPSSTNMGDWAANWNPAQRTAYFTSHTRFASSIAISSNTTPFTQGKAAYVWGFKGDASSGEWILFRATSWTWPNANSSPPANLSWFAKDATPVIGSINSSGSPFLMRSAAVTNAAPPATSFAQWQADYLSGESLNGPNDDPDKDGMPNLLEFVFGTLPNTAGAPVATPVTLVDGHLQITVPRRTDRTATLTIEVSDNLKDWNSGASYTQVVDDGVSALVVRDLSAIDASRPRRFMKLRTTITGP